MNTYQSDEEKTREQLHNNGRDENDEGLFKRAGSDSLMVDKDGFVKEPGTSNWRRYDENTDRP